MASTYVNDLRLNEMATGDESGNWGVVTNSNLELIGEALGYGTEGITTNADTHTTTVADGATDPGRAMYIEYTGTLDSACTITIAPNTLNRVHLIENGTSGSQNIIISQGSGANITIPPGDTKAVYLDGAGSGAAVVDAFASLSVVDLKVQDDLTVTDDVIIGGDIDLEGSIDVNGTANLDIVDIDGAVDMATTALVTGVLTTTAATVFNGGFASNADSTMGTDKKIQFRDAAIHISSSADGQLDLVADTEIQIAATTIDINGAINASGEIIAASLDISGDIDVDGTTNLDVVDIDGAVDMASTLNVDGAVTIASSLAANGAPFIISNTSNGNNIDIKTTSSNSLVHAIKIHSSGVFEAKQGAVFNEDGADVDFRVESDGNVNMLNVNGENDRVGIGVDPSYRFHVEDANANDNKTIALFIGTASAGSATDDGGQFICVNRNAPISQANGVQGGIALGTANPASACVRIQSNFKYTSGRDMQFLTSDDNTAAPTEKMVIKGDGGLVCIGDTTERSGDQDSVKSLQVTGAEAVMGIKNTTVTDASQRGMIIFTINDNSAQGRITCNNDSTLFTTLSDYRLKEVLEPLPNGLDRLNQLNPVKFKWKKQGSTREGFLAHEVAEIYPEAVSGEKDGKDMQSVDYGRITPLLVKAIQEQQTLIEDLKTRIETLEGE